MEISPTTLFVRSADRRQKERPEEQDPRITVGSVTFCTVDVIMWGRCGRRSESALIETLSHVVSSAEERSEPAPRHDIDAGSILRSLRLARTVVSWAIDDVALAGPGRRLKGAPLNRCPFLTGSAATRAHDTELARYRSLLARLVRLGHYDTSSVGRGQSARPQQCRGD